MPACNKNHKLCSSQLLFFISKMILYNAEDLDSRYSMCGLRADNMAIGCVLVRTADESAYYSDSLWALKLFKKNIYLFIWLCRILVAACGIFIAACGIFSCGMWTLSCSVWDLVPWPGIEPGLPALGARSLSHWTTWEVLDSLWFLFTLKFKVAIDYFNYCVSTCTGSWHSCVTLWHGLMRIIVLIIANICWLLTTCQIPC